MDAVTFIHKHMDMRKIMEYYGFDRISEYGGMIRACCKIHGGDNPSGFVVNTNNNLYYCHTADCGGGDAFDLVMKLEDLVFPDAVQKVASILGIDIEHLDLIERLPSYVEENKKWISTMQQTSKKPTVSYSLDAPTRDVTKFRDFDTRTLEHFGLKFVEHITLKNKRDEPYTLYNRLLFPIYFENTLVGVSLRRIKSSDIPKWSHQPVHLQTKHILYNYDAVLQAINLGDLMEIVICEGIVDVWAYHELGKLAVATFGAHLTEEQYRLLIRTGADLIWSYDGDAAGIAATKHATDLFKLKANQYVVFFEDGEDPASIPREELRKRYESRKRLL